MQIVDGLGHDPGDAEALEYDRREHAGFDRTALSDDGHIGSLNLDRAQEFFIGAVALDRERDIVTGLIDLVLIQVDGRHVVAKFGERARHAAAEAAEANDCHPEPCWMSSQRACRSVSSPGVRLPA